MRGEKVDINFWLALTALAVAVWAVVLAYRDRPETMVWHNGRFIRLAAYASVIHWDLIETHRVLDSRLSALEARVEKVENGFLAATAPLSVEPWPEVIRTTSEKRPEVRNVRTEEP